MEVIDEQYLLAGPFVPLQDHRLGDVMVNSVRLMENNVIQWLIGFNNCTVAFSTFKSIDLTKNDQTRIPGLVGLIES